VQLVFRESEFSNFLTRFFQFKHISKTGKNLTEQSVATLQDKREKKTISDHLPRSLKLSNSSPL